MFRIFSLALTIFILIGGGIFAIGYFTNPEYQNSITVQVPYSLEFTWQELIKIKNLSDLKPDVASVIITEQYSNLIAWRENLKNGGYRIYRMNERKENKVLVLELIDSSYGLRGTWTFELAPLAGDTQIKVSEKSTLNNIKTLGLRVIFGRDHDLLVWIKCIKVSLVQASVTTP
jgi:hypothetical protein